MSQRDTFARWPLGAVMVILVAVAAGVSSCSEGTSPSAGKAGADVAAVAKLNWTGVQRGTGQQDPTPISKALEGAFLIDGGKASPKCDDQSLRKFELVARQYPTFPFSHYALASCLRKQGNALWKAHAEAAINILTKTAAVPGHHANHDQALARAKEWLASGAAPSAAP